MGKRIVAGVDARTERKTTSCAAVYSSHTAVIVSSDLLVSAQNKRMDLSPNCSHNKGVCFIRASQGSGAPCFQF